MERIFTDFTGAIRNGYTVKKYLNDANLMGDQEIKEIAAICLSIRLIPIDA